MLKPSEYIVDELKQKSDMLAGFNIRYAFDNRLKAHIIQISPRDKFREDEQLLDWEFDFMERFEDLYNGEDLILSEPFSFHDMSSVLYENECKIETKVKKIEMFFTEGNGVEPIPYIVPYFEAEWSEGTFSSSNKYNSVDSKSQSIPEIDYKYTKV